MQKGKDKVRRDISLIYPARQALGTTGRKRGQGTRGTHGRGECLLHAPRSFLRPLLRSTCYAGYVNGAERGKKRV